MATETYYEVSRPLRDGRVAIEAHPTRERAENRARGYGGAIVIERVRTYDPGARFCAICGADPYCGGCECGDDLDED